MSVDAQLFDQEPEERFRLLRLTLGDDAFKVVGDGGEIGRRRPTSGLVRGRRGEFGLLAVEVFEARVEPREPLVAAFGGELALLEGLVVALESLLGPGDLGAASGESSRQPTRRGTTASWSPATRLGTCRP